MAALGGCPQGISGKRAVEAVNFLLGYTHAKIPTQSTSWVACKVYLDLGFRPIPKNAVNSRKGWEIVKTLTDHPALASFSAVAMEDILAE